MSTEAEMERGNGLWSPLKRPAVYDAIQRLMGAESVRRWFADDFIRAKPGYRVLDIGCGTADLLRFLPEVEYVGYEPNSNYVAQAQLRFPAARIETGYFDEGAVANERPFDLAVASAVLHHLDDATARRLLTNLWSALKPGGRFISLDNVLIRGQNPVARLLIKMDRGRHVRTPDAYRDLPAALFVNVKGRVIHRRWPPYTYWIMTAERASSAGAMT